MSPQEYLTHVIFSTGSFCDKYTFLKKGSVQLWNASRYSIPSNVDVGLSNKITFCNII